MPRWYQELCAATVISWSHSDLTSWDLVTHFASGAMCRQLRICNSIILLHPVIEFAASPETYRKAAHTLKLQDNIGLSFTGVDGHCTMVRDSNNF